MEHDGSVYACDRCDYPEYRLGNIATEALGDMALKRAQVQFGYAQSETLPSQCRKFTFLKNCGGECPKIPVCCVEWAVSKVRTIFARACNSFLPTLRLMWNTSSRTSVARANVRSHEMS